jgi:hypothetical protein
MMALMLGKLMYKQLRTLTQNPSPGGETPQMPQIYSFFLAFLD